MDQLDIPTQGRSQLIGQTGMLVAFGTGIPHPLGQGVTICVSLYALRTGLVLCLSDNPPDEPCGLTRDGFGKPVPMDWLVPYAQRFIQPLPTGPVFQEVLGLLRGDFSDARWEVCSSIEYSVACRQLQQLKPQMRN